MSIRAAIEELADYVERALEAIMYVRPEKPGLTSDELRSIAQALGHKTGLLDDALVRLQKSNRIAQQQGLFVFAIGVHSPSVDFMYGRFNPEHRNFDALDTVVGHLKGLAEDHGIAKASASRDVLILAGTTIGIARHDMLVAFEILRQDGMLVEKDNLWCIPPSHFGYPLPSVSVGIQQLHPQRREEFERVYECVERTLGTGRMVMGTGGSASSPPNQPKAASVEPRTQPGGTTGMATTTRIFISHTHDDAKLAKALIDVIEAGLVVPPEAIRCTSVDGYTLAGGDNAPEVLRDNLKGCDVVLGVLTTTSMSSSYVLMELGAAWGFKKRAVPLIGPGATFGDVPGPFKGVIHALRMEHEPDMSGLVTTLANETRLVETNNKPKIVAALKTLAELVTASVAPHTSPRDAVGAALAAPAVTPPIVGDAEALDLAKAWLLKRPVQTTSLTYEQISKELPVSVGPEVLRRVLPTAAQGTNWTVAAHEHTVVLTYNQPVPIVTTSPRRGF